MKKHIFSLFLSIFLLILSVFSLTGCSGSTDSSAIPEKKEGETENPDAEDKTSATDSPVPFSHAKPHQAPADTDYVFPEAASFIDDAGKPIQRDGRLLYSYYSGRLIRFDKETGETSLLYQTASTHKLDFCLHENDIYFVERTGYDSLDDRDTSLWRIGKDGSDLTLLQNDIVNAATVRDWCNYSIDIYDNILYLINYTHRYENGNYLTETANLYYRLENDGSVSEAQEAETLYGTLPYRFSPVYDSDFPTFPCAMRNYGYLFIQDADGKIYRMEPESGARELIDIDTDAFSPASLSGDLLFLYSYKEQPSLYNLSEKTSVPVDIPSVYFSSYPSVFSSEQGFFLCSDLREKNASSGSIDSHFAILHILPDGSADTLFFDSGQTLGDNFDNMLRKEYSSVDDNYFYYCEGDDNERRLMRFSVGGQKTPAPEKLDAWPTFRTSSPAVVTSETESNKTVIGENGSVSHWTKKLFLEEKTAADRQINQTLAEIYSDFESYVDSATTDEQEMYESYLDQSEDFDYVPNSDFSLDVYLDYMDDDTISFCCSYYQYYSYAAHGYYWNDYYVFDRQTGERLSFEDFAGDSSSILKTARPYVEKAAGWEFDQEMLLDISRFSLSEDGYTLYFAPYDIDCYAAGSFLITIPYEAFEMEL